MKRVELRTKDNFAVKIAFYYCFAYAAVVFVASVPDMEMARLTTPSITNFEICGKQVFEKMKKCVPLMTKDEMMAEFCYL